ncbi:deleted in lung and esophageal cancer protein 1 isoform X5 [Nycticebus coucang]|uniref:deleted in lung and esophageal cancer protein 1 isoform X5 n=1 Tax=Nycticebus coucang TaxID=9470 RepID=UPI00234DD400|nr:deleted in lung and esophageal cancer protein 1 isoform X5 [Nycticebus coucang]
METRRSKGKGSAKASSYEYVETTWASTSPSAGSRSPSKPSHAYSEGYYYSFASRPSRFAPFSEPQLLRLRPSSRRTQDISHLLTGVFRNLYSAEVIGEDLSTSLIKARGGENAVHQAFVDELQQIRELYKQRLDEVEMLERHIIQARARALAEKERAMTQAKVHVLQDSVKLPPVKTVFRWCVDSQLLQKHRLICPEDYYSDTVPFCSAPKGNFLPGYSKLTFSCEMRSVPKKDPDKKLDVSCKKLKTFEDDLDYTVDSLTWDSTPKIKQRSRETVKKAVSAKNKNWMNHLRVPQRELERLLLARMESRNQFLKNPRFFPPNTPYGDKSLVFLPKKLAQGVEREQSCADTPVFLAKPSVGFFTDYEIGSVYEMVIALQNTTSTSRYLRVLPPSTPHFALGLGRFPGKGGMVAPGMTCQYIVQFFPDCLGDFDDFILVETQAAHTLLIPLQARRPPPVLTLSPVLDCGYCLIGGIKLTRFICKNVGFSVGKFCIMPKKSWPPSSFRAVATVGFVEQLPFGIQPSVFELAPGYAILVEVLFLPKNLGKAEQTFIIVCDNCQIKELVIVGTGQLVALELIYISGEKSQPEPGELTDLTAQHFIRFEPENLLSTAKKQLIIRNATHVELAFHWQIMKPNLQPLMPGETYSMDSIKYYPDKETAFSIIPEKGVLRPHADHEFILSFSPHELRDFHSVLQMVLEKVPELVSSEVENLVDITYPMDDVIVLEIEVKGSVEPFQVLLEPYALIIPGENYIGINVKKDFKMWNNSKSPIRYMWGKISDCHIIEVEPCTGVIEPNEVGKFELNFTGGVPGPTSQDLLCEIKDSPSPVVLHIEAAFKGPALFINISALQFGLLRLGQKVTNSIEIQNISQLPARWHMKESPVCLKERPEDVSPFHIEPSSGQLHPLGECSVDITLEALHCQRLQTVLELQVENGAWSYLPVYAEIQKPHVYLQSSQVEVSNLYLGVPTKASVILINGTLLPTRFHWGKLLGHQANLCTVTVSPRRGLLGPSKECQINLELTAHTQVGDLPPAVIPVHMAVVGCPISSLRTTYYTTDKLQKEPVIRFGAQVSGGDTVTRTLRLNNSSPCDIRLDWETYTPEDKEDRLVELLVFYGPPFPLRDQAGKELVCPETPEGSVFLLSPSPSYVSLSSLEAAPSVEGSSSASSSEAEKLISVILREHEGMPTDHLYSVSPKQVVVPAGGSSTIYISFTPMLLSPDTLHKVECTGYALGFMSLDDKVQRAIPGKRSRLQGFAVGPLRLDLHGYVRPAQLSVELDYGSSMQFRCQASDLIPEQPCSGVLSELVTTRHLKLINTTEIPHYFRLLVSRPFSVSEDGAGQSQRSPGPKQECEEMVSAGKQLVLRPQENMLVNVYFSLSLELLSYQKLPADQMLPGVDIQQSASGEKEMVFIQNLLLEYSNQTTQVVPLRATVAVPELQLSTSWVDFGTCFVNQERVREVYLMNLSGCRSYWTVLMGMFCFSTCPLLPYGAVPIQDPQEGVCPVPACLFSGLAPPGICAKIASPPIPSDTRVALACDARQDKRYTAEMQAGLWVGEGFPRQHIELPELVCVLSSHRRRPAGASQGCCGLQGVSNQWASRGTTHQCTPKLHHPECLLHCQEQ